jgi:hypothetical protein
LEAAQKTSPDDDVIRSAQGALLVAWKELWEDEDPAGIPRHASDVDAAILEAGAFGTIAPTTQPPAPVGPGVVEKLLAYVKPNQAFALPAQLTTPKAQLTPAWAGLLITMAGALVAALGGHWIPLAMLGGLVAVAAAALAAYGATRYLAGHTNIFGHSHLARGDAWMTLAAWAVALATGIAALYFDQTFGTPTDYAIALLWGLTTATAVDALGDVLRVRRAPVTAPDSPTAGS